MDRVTKGQCLRCCPSGVETPQKDEMSTSEKSLVSLSMRSGLDNCLVGDH